MAEKFQKLSEGRLSTAHYFLAILILGILFYITINILFLYNNTLGNILYSFIFLFFYLLSLPLTIRRLHDLGWSGILAIVGLGIGFYLNLISIFFYLILIIISGTKNKNKYGEKPSKDIKFIDAILNRTSYGGNVN